MIIKTNLKLILSFFLFLQIVFGYGNISQFEMGTAMYRKLGASSSIFIKDHWHAGIFQSFYMDGNNGVMPYIEMDGGPNGHTSIHHESGQYISITSYASSLTNLKQSMITSFDKGLTYYGAYNVNNISPATRGNIISTSNDLRSVDSYCMFDMIRPIAPGVGVPIVQFISEIRCDGVIEYAYEKNNVLVSNPPHNVATCNYDDLEEYHNNLHQGDYQYPELCPRIQSGEGHGGNSSSKSNFNSLSVAQPIINTFSSTTDVLNQTQLSFKVLDNASTKAYILILVKKTTENDWKILKDTDNNLWRFRQKNLTDYSQNLQQDQFFVFWSGDYSGGYYNEDGTYQLKIVAIDQGANYKEFTTTFYADINPHELVVDLSKSGSSTIIADARYGSGIYTNYTWWYRNDDGVAQKNDTKAPPTGQWIYNSSWDNQTSVNFSPSYSWSIKCQVTDSNGDTDYDIYSEGISPSINNDILVKSLVHIPDKIVLLPNSPNPFNPTTNIKFGLPNMQKVELIIYSLNGDRIRELVNNTMSAGYHSVSWNATSDNGAKVSSGVYIYQLKCGNDVFTKKMIFAK